MIDGINYYQILGVPEDALLKEIQSAWRTFVKDNHEDVVPQFERPATRERMFRINEAYAVLSHEEKRGDYDNAHRSNSACQKVGFGHAARRHSRRFTNGGSEGAALN